MRRTAVAIVLVLVGLWLPACAASVGSPSTRVKATTTAEAPTAEESAATDPTRPVPQPDDELSTAEIYVARGYVEVVTGNVWARWADAGSFMCDRYDCTEIDLYVARGCPSMLYVEANILTGSTVVGRTNASPGAVGPESDVTLRLEDIRGDGDGYRLSKVNCY